MYSGIAIGTARGVVRVIDTDGKGGHSTGCQCPNTSVGEDKKM
jgi:hypothetical protein